MEGLQKRWSTRKKAEVVLQLLRGEVLDAVSRETTVPVSVLSRWREDFIEAGIAGLKGKSLDDARIAKLEKKVGQQAMEIGL
ncbi:MAG: hypothetical protein C4326_10090 [Ignavibacteria bacterium]